MGRSSHGERGLKQGPIDPDVPTLGSLLPRGAWIETRRLMSGPMYLTGRSSHGERGLKLVG